ncbi:hypothetical protein [Veillonella caviae]|uniref:hypothetical protein n=1 Tax=Veillonella caviae TaxID=248316 RepID=UPI0023F50DF0|nr:hypothetical protein [Veillonella caviae]MCI6408009.1 hypothetical protein [Veillonella caviae]MDY6225276.1 hypothetical protein [Veillonella caviae]
MISTHQISQQKTMIEDLYKLVQEAPDSEQKTSAIAYCEGCIAACDLGAKVLASQSKTAKKEEKPKRKRTTKKKEEPIIEEVAEDDDLDDLL